MKIGIVGHGADKFDEYSKKEAKRIIESILLFNSNSKLGRVPRVKDVVLVSGHSPVGGIDIWSEEVAKELGIPMDLKVPEQYTWDAQYGYKQRNLDIAKDSDVLWIILVDKYPEGYKGMKFAKCYHCGTSDHVKSGACWTAKQARKLGKEVNYHIIKRDIA